MQIEALYDGDADVIVLTLGETILELTQDDLRRLYEELFEAEANITF